MLRRAESEGVDDCDVDLEEEITDATNEKTISAVKRGAEFGRFLTPLLLRIFDNNLSNRICSKKMKSKKSL